MKNVILNGNSIEELKKLEEKSINTCVTSPPYFGLRDYGIEGQFGLEESPEEYVEQLIDLFREVKRVLRDDGTVWLNIGDSFGNGTKAPRVKSKTGIDSEKRHKAQGKRHGGQAKQLLGIPWKVAFALQEDGWYLRSDIIWHKPNPMPESVKDRPTRAHEYIFLLSKKKKYYYDVDAIREPLKEGVNHSRNRTQNGGGSKESLSGHDYSRDFGTMKSNPKGKNKRSVWTITTKPFKGAHFATFPKDLIEPCILAGCPKGGTVLDPFFGSGTTGIVAKENGRNFIGVELNPEYAEIAENRLKEVE